MDSIPETIDELSGKFFQAGFKVVGVEFLTFCKLDNKTVIWPSYIIGRKTFRLEWARIIARSYRKIAILAEISSFCFEVGLLYKNNFVLCTSKPIENSFNLIFA